MQEKSQVKVDWSRYVDPEEDEKAAAGGFNNDFGGGGMVSAVVGSSICVFTRPPFMPRQCLDDPDRRASTERRSLQ